MPARFRIVLLTAAVLLAAAAPAHAQDNEYEHCVKTGDAIIIDVSRATCEEARALATTLTAAPPDAVEATLVSAGWAPLRAAATGFQRSYDLVATRGTASVFIRRPGDAPDLDGWGAGRELVFSRGRLVPGAPAPRGSAVCTSAFLIRLNRRMGGLSAAHCGGLNRKSNTTRRRHTALRRPPQPGIVLGRVQRNLERKTRLDALVLPVPSGAGRRPAAIVDRGIMRPPLFVAGTARPLSGRRVCFTGRTSGADQCGRIAGRLERTGLICTGIFAREGDSGGPVYTPPGADGRVRAVGLTAVVLRLLGTMCFTPIRPVLDALHARLVTYGEP